MRNVDELIDEALDAEERELLRAIGEEPGFVERALGMFGAGVRWMVVFMMVGQTLLFVAGVWAAWSFFEATDPVTQLRWGLPAAVLLLASLDGQARSRAADPRQPDDARAEADRAPDRAYEAGRERLILRFQRGDDRGEVAMVP